MRRAHAMRVCVYAFVCVYFGGMCLCVSEPENTCICVCTLLCACCTRRTDVARAGITVTRTTAFVQGVTRRWGIAWSHLPASAFRPLSLEQSKVLGVRRARQEASSIEFTADGAARCVRCAACVALLRPMLAFACENDPHPRRALARAGISVQEAVSRVRQCATEHWEASLPPADEIDGSIVLTGA